MTIILSVTCQASPGKEKALEDLLKGLVAPSRQEAGCIQYDFHRSTENPGQFLFYEIWETQAAFDAHHQSPHIQAFRENVGDLLAKPGDRNFWEKV